MRLTGWQATTFLVGEFQLAETEDHPVFTVADGLVWLYQSVDRNSMVRKMNVMKMRGQASIPGLHTFRITERGIQVFPRLIFGQRRRPRPVAPARRNADRRGCRSGCRVSTRCWAAAFRPAIPSSSPDRRDRARASSPRSSSARAPVAANRASSPSSKSARANTRRPAPSSWTRPFATASVGIVHTRPLDLSIDETLHELTEAIHRLKARRVVIDSLSGFELALAPTFREDFRESLYRLVATLTGMGLTVMMTAELEDQLHGSPLQSARHGVSDRRDHPAAVPRDRRPVASA